MVWWWDCTQLSATLPAALVPVLVLAITGAVLAVLAVRWMDADQPGMLQNLINALRERLAALEAHAAKDVTVLEADIVKAKDAVEAELSALLAKLQGL